VCGAGLGSVGPGGVVELGKVAAGGFLLDVSEGSASVAEGQRHVEALLVDAPLAGEVEDGPGLPLEARDGDAGLDGDGSCRGLGQGERGGQIGVLGTR
jgi:hypothetical protein